MSNQANSTPTPWELDLANGWIYVRTGPLTRVVIAQMESGSDDDAALIVHAVNSLPALVKALEDITNVSARSTSSSDHDRLHAALDALDKARDIARAALASHKTGG